MKKRKNEKNKTGIKGGENITDRINVKLYEKKETF